MASKIRDYIIDIDNVETTTKVVKRNVNEPKFTIVEQNDSDFIINKKSKRIDKDLVVLVSQELFYIKDNKTNEIIKLEDYNSKRYVGNFLRGSSSELKLEKPTWIKYPNSDSIQEMISNDSFKLKIKHGFTDISNWEFECIKRYVLQNKKLLKYYHDKFGDYNMDLMSLVFKVEENYNYNNAKAIIDVFAENTQYKRSTYIEYIFGLAQDFNLDFNSLLRYVTQGFYSQGIDCVDYNTKDTYKDYLYMCNEMFGKVKDKYPKSLKTQHDIISLKYRLWKKYKKELAIFDVSEKNRELVYNDKKYKIIIPENSAEVIDESINQSNCLASYVDKIANNSCIILFMRDVKAPEESLITIEVRGDEIRQAKGYDNRQPNEEEKSFLKKWAKEKKLKVVNY